MLLLLASTALQRLHHGVDKHHGRAVARTVGSATPAFATHATPASSPFAAHAGGGLERQAAQLVDAGAIPSTGSPRPQGHAEAPRRGSVAATTMACESRGRRSWCSATANAHVDNATAKVLGGGGGGRKGRAGTGAMHQWYGGCRALGGSQGFRHGCKGLGIAGLTGPRAPVHAIGDGQLLPRVTAAGAGAGLGWQV